VKRDLPSPAEYHLYSLVLYTLRLRLSTPSTKGESSVACVLRHVLRNTITQLLAGFCVLSPSIGTTRGEIDLSSVVYLMFMIVLSVREGLQHGTQDISAADHPNFLWPPASFDISDVYKGFLRGPLLITVSYFSFKKTWVLLTRISGI
jgi:hypothetical protein